MRQTDLCVAGRTVSISVTICRSRSRSSIGDGEGEDNGYDGEGSFAPPGVTDDSGKGGEGVEGRKEESKGEPRPN